MSFVKEKNTVTLEGATNEDVNALIADKTACRISHIIIHGCAQIDDAHLRTLVEFIKADAAINTLEYHQGAEDNHVSLILADALSANPHIARCVFRLGDCTISHAPEATQTVTRLQDIKKVAAVAQREEELAKILESKLTDSTNILVVYPQTKEMQEHTQVNADETSCLILEMMDMEKNFASPPPAYAANASSKPPCFESRFAAIKERLPAILFQMQEEQFGFSPEKATEFLRFLQSHALAIGKDLCLEPFTGPLDVTPLHAPKQPVLGAFTAGHNKAPRTPGGVINATNDNDNTPTRGRL